MGLFEIEGARVLEWHGRVMSMGKWSESRTGRVCYSHVGAKSAGASETSGEGRKPDEW